MEDRRVPFQDEHIVVAVKPYGVLSEAHDSQPNLPAMISEQLGCEIYPVHRLDKTTQGLMLYAKTQKAAAELSAMIQHGEVEKIYLAVAEGTAEQNGELSDLLYFDRRMGKSYVVRRERKGVKRAVLTYERLNTGTIGDIPVSLLKINLQTGRTHQIRVQLASRKMPLAGDRRYGSHIAAKEIALCSSQLRFSHPFTGEPLHFTYTPADAVFQKLL